MSFNDSFRRILAKKQAAERKKMDTPDVELPPPIKENLDVFMPKVGGKRHLSNNVHARFADGFLVNTNGDNRGNSNRSLTYWAKRRTRAK